MPHFKRSLRGSCFPHGPRYWMLQGGKHGARRDRDCRCDLCMARVPHAPGADA